MIGFQDYSNGSNAWDGTDLIFSTWQNSHRNYIWNTSSQSLLTKFKNDNNGAVDVSKFKYSPTNYDISATKILGGTLYENITGGRGEKIQQDLIIELK